MMSSVLVSPDGNYEYEGGARHHNPPLLQASQGRADFFQSVATIYAWTGALRKRGELDGNDALVKYSDSLDKACIDTINSGIMTGDIRRAVRRAGERCQHGRVP
jgi:isocitrate dehydrogenase